MIYLQNYSEFSNYHKLRLFLNYPKSPHINHSKLLIKSLQILLHFLINQKISKSNLVENFQKKFSNLVRLNNIRFPKYKYHFWSLPFYLQNRTKDEITNPFNKLNTLWK